MLLSCPKALDEPHCSVKTHAYAAQLPHMPYLLTVPRLVSRVQTQHQLVQLLRAARQSLQVQAAAGVQPAVEWVWQLCWQGLWQPRESGLLQVCPEEALNLRHEGL